MAFRLPPTIDGRVRNEDAITVPLEISRKNQQDLEQNNRQPMHVMDGDGGPSLDSSYQGTSTRSSDYRQQRAKAYSPSAGSGWNIVFPDPVAFRCVSWVSIFHCIWYCIMLHEHEKLKRNGKY